MFWTSAAAATALVIAIIVVIPESSVRSGGRFDIMGAVVLADFYPGDGNEVS